MALDNAKLQLLYQRLRHLEEDSQSGQFVESHYCDLMKELLEHDGYSVVVSPPRPFNGFYLTAIRDQEGRTSKIGVEFNRYAYEHILDPKMLDGAVENARLGRFDHLILVSDRPYSAALRDLARRTAPVSVSLFDLQRIREWIDRSGKAVADATRGLIELTQEFLRRAARIIAMAPEQLRQIEWRNLEQLLGEVFSKLGFQVEVTPASDDGGKDVVLTAVVHGHKRTYFVELKHWLEDKPGPSLVKRFLELNATERTHGGLFLASSGFTLPTFEVLAEVGPPLALGDSQKVVALCRTFVRAESGFLSPSSDPFNVLSDDATLVRNVGERK